MKTQITYTESFIDGSGLTAVIMVDGECFSGNYLGDVRMNYVKKMRSSGPSGWRYKAMLAAATKEFQKLVDQMGPKFFEMNHAMYA